MTKKKLGTLIAVALVLCLAVGATMAWLTDKTDPVTNTFTISDINIELTETTGTDYQMIPGYTLDKDPYVTVYGGSEKCYVFVQVAKSGGNVTVDGTDYHFDDFLKYEVDKSNWTQLIDEDPADGIGVEGIYYCVVDTGNNDTKIKVIGYTDNEEEWHPNQVLVKDTVTKQMMNALETEGVEPPILKFAAYACQYYKSNEASAEDKNGTPFGAYEAWTKLSK